jgi:hypothetical protein
MRNKPRFLLLGTALVTLLTLTPAAASTASAPCSEAAAAISDPATTISTTQRCHWRVPYRCCTHTVSKHQLVTRCIRARTR